MHVRINGTPTYYCKRGPQKELADYGKYLKKQGLILNYRVVRMTPQYLGEPQNDHELHVNHKCRG